MLLLTVATEGVPHIPVVLRLFAILSHNALSATAFCRLPPVALEIGIHLDIQVASVKQYPAAPAAGLFR